MYKTIYLISMCVRTHAGIVCHARRQVFFASLGLKFLVNSQHKWFGQSKRKGEKIFSLISPVMKVTIPGTHGISGLFSSKTQNDRSIIRCHLHLTLCSSKSKAFLKKQKLFFSERMNKLNKMFYCVEKAYS